MEQASARACRPKRPSGSNTVRLQLDRFTQKQNTFASADSRECNGLSAVHYNTVFSCSSTRLWLLSRLLIELREERTPSDRLFLWVAEIELHRCREECSFLFSRRTVSSGCFEEGERWVIGANVVPCHVSCQSRFRRPVRLRTTAVARIQPMMMK